MQPYKGGATSQGQLQNMKIINAKAISLLLAPLASALTISLAPPAVAGDSCCDANATDCCKKQSKGGSDKTKTKGKAMSDKQNKPTILTVALTQSGGFAGVNQGYEIIFADLDSAAQNKLQDLVIQSGILESKDAKKLNQSARDVFVYGIKVNTSSGVHQAQFDDTTIPDSYRPLMEYLRDNQSKQK